MSVTTTIAWCDATWSPWIGCSPVHVGCEHCYAAAQAGRFGVVWGQHGTRRKTSEAYWQKPLAWNRKAAPATCIIHTPPCSCAGSGRQFRVFPSLCDVFEDWDGPMLHHSGQRLLVSDEEPDRYLQQPTATQCPKLTKTEKENLRNGVYRHVWMRDLRRDLFRLIDHTPHLTWILATKRPENIRKMWGQTPLSQMASIIAGRNPDEGKQRRLNVHLLYSASDQETLEAGLPHLLACRDLAPVIGLSLEPLLGLVDLNACWPGGLPRPGKGPYVCGVDLVVIGGESGPHARPCEIEWIRSIVEQCKEAGVPCFVKQDVGRKPGQQGRIPDELWRVKELPKCDQSE